MKRLAACSVGLMLLGTACAKTTAMYAPRPSQPSRTFVAWSQNSPLTKHICVLPFTNQTKSTGLADRVRESFFGRLALKRFTDIELRDLDVRLHALPEAWSRFPPQKLGRALQCDALVYGEVTEASNLYLGVYAQLTLEGRIQLIETASGQTLVTGSHVTKFRAGGVPLSLLAVVPNAMLNLRNFTPEQSLRAVDDLARNLADKIPDLPQVTPVTTVASVERASPAGGEQKGEATLSADPAAPDRYRVQVAAFSKPGEARHVAQLLRNEGFQPTVVTAATTDRLWHKVILGPFPSLDVAQETGARVQQRFRLSPMVVRSQ